MSRHRLIAALGVATAACALLTSCNPLAGTPASGGSSASTVFNRPANGVFAISGHGWGHGHGMSQWGAQGAATLGKSADTILATYYPGTAKATLANSSIRVLLAGDDTTDTQVLPAAGLTATDGVNRRLVLPAGANRWRVLADNSGLHLQRLDTGWSTVAVGGVTALASPVRLATSSGVISVVFPDGSTRAYRGVAQAVRRTTGTGLYSTVVLPMESYLRGVVPNESSPSWQPAALQAQAVAARTYAAQRRATATAAPYDICDSSACQAFSGSSKRAVSGLVTSYEYASTDAAVAATAGQIRTYAGKPAFTEFSSSNGGWSTSGGQPYLVAKADPWDGAVANSVHNWKANLPVTALEAHYPAVGKLLRLRVTGRDGNGEWGGRVTTVVLEGVDRTGKPTAVAATGGGIELAHSWPSTSDGLRSDWWHIDTP